MSYSIKKKKQNEGWACQAHLSEEYNKILMIIFIHLYNFFTALSWSILKKQLGMKQEVPSLN